MSSFSIEPWHGTLRLLSPPAPEELDGVDVVHLHTVADWFDVPRWLETLPRRISVVISLHDMWHVTGGCFLYRGCDRYAIQTHACDSCPILRWPANRFLAKAAHPRKLRTYQNCGARIVANSQWLAEIAGRSPIAKALGGVRVISPGIDTTVFRPQHERLVPKASRFTSGRVCDHYRWRVAEHMQIKMCRGYLNNSRICRISEGVSFWLSAKAALSVPDRFKRTVYRWHSRPT